MCQAMGRSITAVIFGGAGSTVAPAGETKMMEGEITIGSVDNMVQSLLEAQNIMIVPGCECSIRQSASIYAHFF
jgi:NAD/NADP transhydrogenase beta subunit